MLLLTDHSIKNLNTFGVDIKAKLFAEINSEDELAEILSDNNFKQEKKFILGGGSNTLFTKDFDGVIIKISIPGINLIEENSDSVIVEAGAGNIWDELVKFTINNNYGGIENLTFIPGTVGAAPIQNIGAYGQELADTFVSLKGVKIKSGGGKIFYKDDCKFSYRSSIFKEELRNEFVVTSVRLKLSKNPVANTSYKTLREYLVQNKILHPTIREASNVVRQIRSIRLPDPAKIGNAGSFFKNPLVSEELFLKIKSEFPDISSFPADTNQVKVSAGWLIEKCGWKGKRIGDVGTSPDHALVVCNFGKAIGKEILEFTMHIKEDVKNKFGIELDAEVNII